MSKHKTAPSVQVFVPEARVGNQLQNGHTSTRLRAFGTVAAETRRNCCSSTDAEHIRETQLPFVLPAVSGKFSLSNPI